MTGYWGWTQKRLAEDAAQQLAQMQAEDKIRLEREASEKAAAVAQKEAEARAAREAEEAWQAQSMQSGEANTDRANGSADQDFFVRANVLEAVRAGISCRTTITEVYQRGTLPAMPPNGWGCEGASSSSKYVRRVTTSANGVISVVMQGISSDIDGKAVTFVPADASGAALTYAPGVAIKIWICGGAGTTVPLNYLPTGCRGL